MCQYVTKGIQLLDTKMTVYYKSLFNRISYSAFRNHSTAVEAASVLSEEPLLIKPLRTLESNPVNHNQHHLTRFYTIPAEIKTRIFLHSPLPISFEKHVKTFRETALMVREPAINIISYLEQTDYSRPVNKYVLYGNIGTGKTISLAHILHYGIVTNKILIHVNWALDWFEYFKEKCASKTKEGFQDLPVDAAAWLLRFKHQNAFLLSSLDLKLQTDYVWNTREQHSSGSSLLQLVDYGIARVKYACDVVEAVINELKWSSIAGKCNCLVVIDGFNAFFGTRTRIKDAEYKLVYGDKVSLVQPFLNITKYDWCNGAVVVTVDVSAMHPDHQKSNYPRYLLGDTGFEHLEPFLPIEVNDYTADEFCSIMDYYRDRKWLRNVSKQGQRELELISNRNPLTVMQYTNSI